MDVQLIWKSEVAIFLALNDWFETRETKKATGWLKVCRSSRTSDFNCCCIPYRDWPLSLLQQGTAMTVLNINPQCFHHMLISSTYVVSYTLTSLRKALFLENSIYFAFFWKLVRLLIKNGDGCLKLCDLENAFLSSVEI